MRARGSLLVTAVFVVAWAAPLLAGQPFLLPLLFRVAIFAVVGIAWNLLGGYAGQLSLGHAAYFGLGAYGFSLLHASHAITLGLSLLVGGAIACAAALVIGMVTFRLRGPYFALSTLAAAEIVRIVALNSSFTHGAIGVLAPSLFTAPGVDAKFYSAALLLLAVALSFASWTHGSRFGYCLRALREDEDTAMAVGIDPTRYKLLALLPSALLTGMAGAVYASFSQFVGPESVLDIDISVEAVIIAMLGGVATPWGPVLGSAVLMLSSEAFKAFFHEGHLLIYGALLIVVVLVVPEGLASLPARIGRLGRPKAGP